MIRATFVGKVQLPERHFRGYCCGRTVIDAQAGVNITMTIMNIQQKYYCPNYYLAKESSSLVVANNRWQRPV